MDFPRIDQAVGFACQPITSGGYTWTWTSVMGQLLATAEELFGDRDPSYTPLGVEFVSEGGPRTWYPGNRRHVIIQLSENARIDPNRAVYQLAHEVVHLLAPTGTTGAALCVEEGLASLFSDSQAPKWGSTFWTNDPAYRHCMTVSEPLFARPELVRHLRAHRPSFNDWDPGFIRDTASDLSEIAATELCRPFSDIKRYLLAELTGSATS